MNCGAMLQVHGVQVLSAWNSDWIQFQWSHAIQQEQIAIKELTPIAIAGAL